MRLLSYLFSVLLTVAVTGSCTRQSEFRVVSPDGNLTAVIEYNSDKGSLEYSVSQGNQQILLPGAMGLNTDAGDFSSGVKLKKATPGSIDETYTLPQGKVSSYQNKANELLLTVRKARHTLDIRFRVYNDGVAFRYEIDGAGEVTIHYENSTVALAGNDFTYWGQPHPNRYGYESALGPIEDDMLSTPVLAQLKDSKHFALIGQAATYGNYIQPHFKREGSVFHYRFPLDQEKTGPVVASLPFKSPWRMIIISPDNPGRIVESYMMENLNPPTRSEYLNDDGSVKDWIRPGNVMWDYIAKDADKPRMWIDAAAEMGWDYYMADAGFANKWGGADSVTAIVKYAARKNVNVIGWAHTREFNTPEKAAETMSQYASWGLKGAKIDFFDHNTLSENPREWMDYEDTQQSLQMRDWIFELAIKNLFLLELHGNTMPSGERRQFPNLMTLEGVDGMERRTKPAANDLTIPYIRNIMGPVSYTVIHFERSPGTHAYQLAMPVVYEAGLKIYAEHGKKLLEWPGRELISDMPAAWDETKYIEGLPASHIVIARRKGTTWYIAGMTDTARTVTISLNFLEGSKKYDALFFTDGTHDTMKRNLTEVDAASSLTMYLLERGGFAGRITTKQ
ncbi:MAG: glycoside hydrolase family 97 N-terminal domain-containing protein [Bacteroidales bacterium]|nr:glycoside hydrolase family 97 N-terminal domain-containing protein [Bacteroidales bacterium]MBN2632772.1 glycoside hydrolase family 97 N-terminal domain-containing protein [Bacteroidales bacterium]